jgi:hypothetical protein
MTYPEYEISPKAVRPDTAERIADRMTTAVVLPAAFRARFLLFLPLSAFIV